MRVKPLILVPVIAVALAACSAQTPVTPTTEAAVEQPLFSTDEEALAAAQAAYAHYLEVSDQIARDGGANPERLKGLVSSAQYPVEIAPFEELQSSGAAMSGSSSFDQLHIQSIDSKVVSAYLCLDNSAVVLNQNDGSTKQSTNQRWPLQVSFSKNSDGSLVLSGSETWTGTNFC
jgi:hypothetical protein